MKLRANPNGGVYVEFRDRRRRKKAKHVSVEDYTPTQALTLFIRAIRADREHRKAG